MHVMLSSEYYAMLNLNLTDKLTLKSNFSFQTRWISYMFKVLIYVVVQNCLKISKIVGKRGKGTVFTTLNWWSDSELECSALLGVTLPEYYCWSS